jgi:DNA mismatch repair protein MutS
MTGGTSDDLPDKVAAIDPMEPLTGLLWETSAAAEGARDADSMMLSDLRLDQVVDAAVKDRPESDLVAGLLRQVNDVATVRYRHEVFADLEVPAVSGALDLFSTRMRAVGEQLAQLPAMRSSQQRQCWFVDAAAAFCDAVTALAGTLADCRVRSRALAAFRDYLSAYVASPEFAGLAADTADCQSDLARIRYLVRIRGLRVEVSKYSGEADFSAEIEQTFARFRQGATEEYGVRYRGWPPMDHVGAQILGLVARLFDGEFAALDEFCRRHAAFADPVLRRAGREIQFYLAWLEYIRPLRAAGLSFCRPELNADSKEVAARNTFDLALASRAVRGGTAVVTNDFELRGPERVLVVSGPNQGGKTTFARAFGQLHHLAATGVPVPGTEARLYACDRIYSHFGREEDIADLTGKLEDDLLRIQRILLAATPRSIVIMNEIFTSTTLGDATFLGRKVLEKATELDLLCVIVTFIDELASFSGSVVSMIAEIDPDNPARRTFKVVRKPADGLAYALAIARKHRVTYEQLRERITA